MVEYFIVESLNGTKSDDTLTSADGFGTFAISFPHQGQVSTILQVFFFFLSKTEFYESPSAVEETGGGSIEVQGDVDVFFFKLYSLTCHRRQTYHSEKLRSSF